MKESTNNIAMRKGILGIKNRKYEWNVIRGNEVFIEGCITELMVALRKERKCSLYRIK
jgi:hypothetical protein